MSQLNSFTALGFPDDEAVVAALRSDLAGIVRGYIQRSQCTQTALARKLAIPQSTVSAILNGNVERLSIEYFLRILARLKLPWSAKCWNSPHDAQWILGGLPQLMNAVSANHHAPQAVPPSSIWSDNEIFRPSLTATGSSHITSQAISTGAH